MGCALTKRMGSAVANVADSAPGTASHVAKTPQTSDLVVTPCEPPSQWLAAGAPIE